MHERPRGLLLCLCVLTASRLLLGQETASEPLTVTAATARAIAANPTIAAARLQRPIDVAGVGVAGERPNPEVQYEASKETPRQAITTTLPIELGGKRQRRIDVATATVAVGDADLVRVIADIRRDVRRAYFEAVAAETRARIAEDVRGLTQRARDAAQARVTAGEVPRSDLTQSDLALANSENELIGARGEVAATHAELNRLLGQPPAAALVLADPLSGPAPMPIDDVLPLVIRANVDVQVLDRQIAEQAAKIELAKALQVPDIAAGGSFTYDAEPEFQYGWRLTGAITLPVFTKHAAGVRVEDATLARLKQQREARVAEIAGEVTAAVARARAAREQIERYEQTILPLALEAERQAQAAYSGGQIGLPALVQALLTARDTRQRGLQVGLDYQHALTDLDRAIGAATK